MKILPRQFNKFQMKRILSIILVAFAIIACDQTDDNTTSFSEENIENTRWKGVWKRTEGSMVKEQADVTLKFITSGNGTFSQKRSATTSKQTYDMKYEISGKNITFDCPVIDGTWEVTGYTETAMTLTLLPSKNGLLILVKE